MTKKIFTDNETGEKYEQFTSEHGAIVIKPLKQDKLTKYPWALKFYEYSEDANIKIQNMYNLTPDQAKKVAEAIEALMELLQTDKHTFNDFEDGRHDAWTTIAKAREALNEDN